jgi:arylsulfatase
VGWQPTHANKTKNMKPINQKWCWIRGGGLAVLGAILATYSLNSASAQTTKPNIIVIMTDDVGWGDLGCYGGGAMRGAPMPNLDQMASKGMHFANYYGQASCIAGRIPIRTSLSSVMTSGDSNGLTKQTPTAAEALKQVGYTTVQLGKWHLGDKPENFPTANGWIAIYINPYLIQFFDEMKTHPNIPYKPWGEGLSKIIPDGR